MIIPLIIGAIAIFIWSKFSGKKPLAKTEALESPSPEPNTLIDKIKEGAPKVAAIVGAGAAAVGGGAAVVGATTIGLSALPAATVLPAGLSAMAPTTLTSAAYGTTPAVVGTGSGTASVGAGAGGASGAGAALAGAGLALAPIIIVPIIAKILDAIFPKHVVTESEQAAMDAAKSFRQEVANLPDVQLVKGQHAF